LRGHSKLGPQAAQNGKRGKKKKMGLGGAPTNTQWGGCPEPSFRGVTTLCTSLCMIPRLYRGEILPPLGWEEGKYQRGSPPLGLPYLEAARGSNSSAKKLMENWGKCIRGLYSTKEEYWKARRLAYPRGAPGKRLPFKTFGFFRT